MGGQTCLTCRHEAREAIDGALVAGEPLRNIAEHHGLSTTALHRHKRGHLSTTLVKAAEDSELAHGGKLLDQVQSLVGKALGSLERAEGKGDERAVQGAIREARHSLELVGRITGELKDKVEHTGTVKHEHSMSLEERQARVDEILAALGRQQAIEGSYEVLPSQPSPNEEYQA